MPGALLGPADPAAPTPMPETTALRVPRPVRQPPPTRYRDEQGDERLYGRRQAVHLYGKVYRPDGHRISAAALSLEEDILPCPGSRSGASTCGVLLYQLASMVARDGTDLKWAVEVTRDEARRMRRMSIAEKLLYLEVTWASP